MIAGERVAGAAVLAAIRMELMFISLTTLLLSVTLERATAHYGSANF